MSETLPDDAAGSGAGETTVRVRITGRVQGVWFRGWTVETAQDLGLDGWVRNRADGSVEAVFQGAEETVARMIAACHDGPPAARVTQVTRAAEPPLTEPGFRQIATL
ncbi:acylphosphatase [Roseospira marina]|uniref:Acylphosphatase n=1 Tax=Roseospira marina TaxID=140057 RepID=A0A5M6I8Y1_9PROT|nr:acylphosphatase [Roseospira marina]KAA5604653.1 acylphosphatase [Roseospira marina]MBB4315097.1 acylphosphatase [Roseospira marina]MBB5088133.1 acylphosphatase [Roseospira marina]